MKSNYYSSQNKERCVIYNSEDRAYIKYIEKHWSLLFIEMKGMNKIATV